jgi:PAS domain S-box-containing protein
MNFKILSLHLGSYLSYSTSISELFLTKVEGDLAFFLGNFSNDELTIKNLQDFIHPADKNRIQKELEKHQTSTGTYSLSYRIKKADNSILWVRDCGEFYVQNESLERRGIIVDITESKANSQKFFKLQTDLDESQTILGAISQSIDKHLMILDGDGSILIMSNSWKEFEEKRTPRIFHESLEWIGQNFLDILREFPDDPMGGMPLYESIQSVLSGETRSYESQVCVFIEGKDHWFAIKTMKLKELIQGVIITRLDITLQKKAEHALEEKTVFLDSVLNSSRNLGIFALNKESRISLLNPAMGEILSLNQLDAIGRNIEALLDTLGMSFSEIQEKMQLAYSKGEIEYEDQNIKGKKDRIYQTQIASVRTYDAQELGFVFLYRDITDLKNYERRMLRLNEELEEKVKIRTRELDIALKKAEDASRAKSIFLANMSHEIRTPMNAIIGMTELVLEMKLEPQQYKLLKTVFSSAKSLMNILNDILDLSRLESGKMTIEFIAFNLFNLLNQVMDMIKFSASKKDLDLELKIPKEIPKYLVGDPTKIRQILTNLIGNSIKFTEKGKITLEVQDLNINNEWLFKIIDTGIGISHVNLGKIFERFSQADDTTTRRFGGTGLGTAISKGLVEEMGGKIWVESEENKGSVFQFIIPLKPIDDSEVSQYDKEENDKIEYWTRPLKILLIEDIPINQELVVIRLSERDHKIDLADNGKIGLEKYESNQYDLILMDVHMPEMNGIEATKKIRVIEKEKNIERIPIFMLTASVLDAEKQECFDAGANEFIVKPIDFYDLYKKIGNYFDVILKDAISKNNDEIKNYNLKIIDFDKGVKSWGKIDEFIKHLNKAFKEYLDFPIVLLKFLSTNENQKALELTHKLKGLMKNFSIQEIPEILQEIETGLNNQVKSFDMQLEKIKPLFEILKEDLVVVQSMILKEEPINTHTDPVQAVKILHELIETFQNSEINKTLINQLKLCISPVDFAKLDEQIDTFDFDSMIQLAQELIERISNSSQPID